MHGEFTDPGADTFTVTINWADGSAATPVDLGSQRFFNLSHLYVGTDKRDRSN